MKNIIEKAISLCCKITKMKREKFLELFLYLFFGVATTAVNFIVDLPLRYIFNVHYTVAITIAWIVAVAFAFITNKIFVFKAKDYSVKAWIKEGIPFVVARLTSLGLEFIITFVAFAIIGDSDFNQMIVKIICQVVVIVFNYFASKLFVFKKKKIK
ncbi:MAG: GtrA family protein [Clostridia bacterium]